MPKQLTEEELAALCGAPSSTAPRIDEAPVGNAPPLKVTKLHLARAAERPRFRRSRVFISSANER